MKTKTTILITFSACLAFGQKPTYEYYDYSSSALPLLAATCDIAGIGEIVSQTRTDAVINVKQCWFSVIPTNTVELFLYGDTVFPTGGTDFVFFATRYSARNGIASGWGRYSHMFRMDKMRRGYHPGELLYLMSSNRALIPVVSENDALISWSSNLVYTSQVNPNMQAFYELMRDGCRFNPEYSRIHSDSLDAFHFAARYMPTNFMQHISLDTNLMSWARADIYNAYTNEINDSLKRERAREKDNALPFIAAMCDIIGIGEVDSKTDTNALINVSELWLGDPQQNRLNVSLEGEDLPENGMKFLFFLSKHPQIGMLEPVEMRLEFMFRPESRSQLKSSDIYFLGGNHAVVPATPANSALISWCSNLVQSSQINLNVRTFYELLRDGHRLSPPSSRMYRDSENAFQTSERYLMPTVFMQQIWADTNLTDWARSILNGE